MAKIQSLADYLGTSETPPEPDVIRLEDITDCKAFAIAVLSSPDFRRYIINGLTLGELPAAVVCRLMDYGWGKPAERVEHSGGNGDPIITEVRRIIVHVQGYEQFDEEQPVKLETRH